MINKQLELDIRKRLTITDGFIVQDFSIISDTDTSSEEPITILTLRMHGTGFIFTATIPHKRQDLGTYGPPDFVITVECIPGEMVDSEKSIVTGRDAFLEKIPTWVTAIKRDIESTYTHRKIKEQEQVINQLVDDINQKDEYFTPEEVDNIRDTLTAQQEKLKQEFEDHIEAEKDLATKLETLEAEFDQLKERLYSQTKKGWFRSWAGRATTWTSNKNSQKLLIEGGKALKAIMSDGNPDV